METTEFKERIKILIESLQITPAAFAKKVGINKQNVYNYIRGELKPSGKIFDKIFQAYPGLSEKWLMNGHGKMWDEIDEFIVNDNKEIYLSKDESSRIISVLKNEIEQFYTKITIRQKIIKILESPENVK